MLVWPKAVWYRQLVEPVSFHPLIYCALRVKSTFPVLAPPMQVLLKEPVGHTAIAARTQPSHRPLLTLIVAPVSAADRLKSALPDEPVVDSGAP